MWFLTILGQPDTLCMPKKIKDLIFNTTYLYVWLFLAYPLIKKEKVSINSL